MTLIQESNKKTCCLTLNSVKLNTTMLVNNLSIDSDLFYELVFLTPTGGSNYGVKFKQMKKLNKKNTDQFIRDILNKLGVYGDSIMIFKNFKSKKSNCKIGAKEIKKKTESPFLLLKNENGISVSLFASIRNSLAHGNIIQNSNWYYLYALTTKNEIKKKDEDKNLKFLLKIKDLNCLIGVLEVLQNYR